MIVEAEEIYIFKERATGVVCVCMCVCVSICLSVGNARVGWDVLRCPRVMSVALSERVRARIPSLRQNGNICCATFFFLYNNTPLSYW